MLYNTLKGDSDQARLSSLQLCSCPHFYEQQHTTTPRTRFPTLWEMWVGSLILPLLTSTERIRKRGTYMYCIHHCPHPKILEHETIFRCKSKGSTFSTVTLYFKTLSVAPVWDWSLNPWSPTSDIERISPYTISTISSRQVMRIKKNTNQGISC